MTRTRFNRNVFIGTLAAIVVVFGFLAMACLGQQPPPPQQPPQPQVVWVRVWTPGQRVWQWATGRPRTPLYQPYVATHWGLQPVVGWVPAQQGGAR